MPKRKDDSGIEQNSTPTLQAVPKKAGSKGGDMATLTKNDLTEAFKEFAKSAELKFALNEAIKSTLREENIPNEDKVSNIVSEAIENKKLATKEEIKEKLDSNKNEINANIKSEISTAKLTIILWTIGTIIALIGIGLTMFRLTATHQQQAVAPTVQSTGQPAKP